jgi:hypothetical protein
VNRRCWPGASSETPDSKGSIRCLVRELGRVAKMNENAIIVAGIAAANTA